MFGSTPVVVGTDIPGIIRMEFGLDREACDQVFFQALIHLNIIVPPALRAVRMQC